MKFLLDFVKYFLYSMLAVSIGSSIGYAMYKMLLIIEKIVGDNPMSLIFIASILGSLFIAIILSFCNYIMD